MAQRVAERRPILLLYECNIYDGLRTTAIRLENQNQRTYTHSAFPFTWPHNLQCNVSYALSFDTIIWYMHSSLRCDYGFGMWDTFHVGRRKPPFQCTVDSKHIKMRFYYICLDWFWYCVCLQINSIANMSHSFAFYNLHSPLHSSSGQNVANPNFLDNLVENSFIILHYSSHKK